jgi:Raf kinase inhibitor-like YbhB/YbcL family protein
MRLYSPAFKHNGFIPEKFTCKGEGINPALEIQDIPGNAQSLALIVDDPDAPGGTFVHWVVFNIPVIQHIGENTVPGELGSNHGGGKDYVSPCPPSGTHRYFFKAYALDTKLDLGGCITKAELEKAISGHILDKAELIGLCKIN